MNIQISRLTGLYLLLTCVVLYADTTQVKDYADKYFTDFNTWQDDGLSYMYARFYRDVPTSMQADVLDEILDRACSAQPQRHSLAISQVLGYIEQFRPDFVPSKRFDTDLSALTKDQNYTTRRDVIEFLGKMNRGQDRDLIVAALSDPQDEVRGAALNALRNRSGSEAIFQKYIQDHQSDPSYHTSVLYAKSGLDAIHAKANGH
jgi:hypothetical protein